MSVSFCHTALWCQTRVCKGLEVSTEDPFSVSRVPQCLQQGGRVLGALSCREERVKVQRD